MYIRKSTRSYKGKTYTNYVLVESVQTPKGPRQTTICSLGDLSPRPRDEWLKLTRKIEDALTGQGRLIEADDAEVADIIGRVRAQRSEKARSIPERTSPSRSGGALIKVDPSRVSTEHHREAGPVHVGHQFWRRLELDRILSECELSEGVCRLACIMTLNRLIAPCSEHAMPAWIKRTALADILEADFNSLDEDRLYRVLDKLHPHRAAVETKLVARERSLFDLDTTVFLYDLTSTYFEGLCPHNPKAQRGHSSDHREDCKQVVSEQRIAKDSAIRTKHEARLRADVDKLTKRVATNKLVDPEKINQAIGRLKERYPRVARYYRLSYDPQSATLVSEFDADRHKKAEQLDGCYLLKTCRKDLSGDEIWRIYNLLTRAEKAFRDMKSPLAERPIFHQREHRVEAHIFLCVLAYHLLISIEKTLLDQNIHTSWATVRDTLKTHQVCTIVLPTNNGSQLCVRKASTPEPDVQDLYKQLDIPSRIIAPRHTWSEPK